MPPRTPKSAASDKPEGDLQTDQAKLPVSVPAATLEAAAQALAAEAQPATFPILKITQDSAANQEKPDSDVIGTDTYLPIGRVEPTREVLDSEMTAKPLAAETLRIRVLRIVEHDGVRYGPNEESGDELEVSEAQFLLLNSIQTAERL